MVCLKIFEPREQIKLVISLVADKIPEQTLKELKTKIPINTDFTKNLAGDSISFPL
jgi:hypothetical protein